MGIIQYTYDNSFPETFIPQITSQYDSDQRGSPCWMISSKIPFKTDVEGLQFTLNTDLVLYIEYLDNQDGYLRIEYDDDGVLTDETIVTYVNDNIWKSIKYKVTARINNLINPGDFQLFTSDTEGTTANISTILRRLGVHYIETGAFGRWQVQKLSPSSIDTLEVSSSGSTESAIQVFGENTQYHYGILATGSDDAGSNPIYIQIGENDPDFWRAPATKRNVVLDITYFDNSTDSIHIIAQDDGGDIGFQFDNYELEKWVTKTCTFSASAIDEHVIALLSSNHTNGSTSILDTSGTNKAITLYGDVSHSTTQKKFGASSIYFDGNDRIQIADIDLDVFRGSIDFWIYPTTLSGEQNLITNNNGGYDMGLVISGGIYQWLDGNSYENTGIIPTLNTWQHIEMVIEDEQLVLFKDGILVHTVDHGPQSPSGTTYVIIGTDSGGGNGYTGWLDEIRVSDITRHSSNFSLETAGYGDFLNSGIYLHGYYENDSDIKITTIGNRNIDSNAVLYLNSDLGLVDISSQAHTITNTSNTTTLGVASPVTASSFDLNGFTITDPGDLAPGTDAFTIMFWARKNTSGWNFLCEEGSDDNWWIGWYGSSFYIGYPLSGSQWEPASSFDCNGNVWNHYYIGSDGAGTLYCFINGTNKATTSYTQWGVPGNPLKFGTECAYNFTGQLADFYYQKGSNVYTNDFALPTLAAIHDPNFSTSGVAGELYISHISLYNGNTQATSLWTP